MGYSHQNVALPCVTDQEVTFPLVYYQPSSQHFSVSLVALGEFADEKAGLVSNIGHPYLSLILKRDDRFSEFESL